MNCSQTAKACDNLHVILNLVVIVWVTPECSVRLYSTTIRSKSRIKPGAQNENLTQSNLQKNADEGLICS